MDAPTYVYKPSWVANTFLVRGREEGVTDIDPLKIQKLVYFFHGWHLATTGCPALGERFEAWPNGPVLSSLYHQFKQFRWRPITSFASDIDPITGQEKASVVAASDERFHEIFDAVWGRYKAFSGPELSDMTHAPDTPWSYARDRGLQYISDEKIRDFFVALGKKALPA